MQPRHHPIEAARAALREGRPLPVVAALLASAALAQLLLGDGLGVHDAWMTLLLAVALFAILIVADAGRAGAGSEQETYDPTTIVLAALAIAAAVACLYLPLPWGGLGAAAVLVGLLGALRMSGGS
jgi:hypothetical protein